MEVNESTRRANGDILKHARFRFLCRRNDEEGFSAVACAMACVIHSFSCQLELDRFSCSLTFFVGLFVLNKFLAYVLYKCYVGIWAFLSISAQ